VELPHLFVFVSREAVEAVTDWGVLEREPESGKRYVAFVDPSGGSADSFILAVAHAEGQIGVLDCLREVRPPFSPEAVVNEFADLLKRYRVTEIVGDKYAGEWAREPFRKHDITYDASAKPKSDLYRDALPLINSAAVRLLGSRRLVAQLTGLERRTSRAGRDSIDHAPGAHDDVANAAAGALLAATAKKPTMRLGAIGVDGRVFWHDGAGALTHSLRYDHRAGRS
jgi:hypothetical protein